MNSLMLSNSSGSVSTPVSTSSLERKIICQQTFRQLPNTKQGLVNAKYRGSQILPRVYPAQMGIGGGFCCLTREAIATQQR
jgi:hypothetical protein